jgi:PAS domain S-box-containing protein
VPGDVHRSELVRPGRSAADASSSPSGCGGVKINEHVAVATADEISSLVATLRETERRLEELTGGDVATAIRGGSSFPSPRAQESRRDELAKQSAILNALPANLALLDAHGVVISVNEAWRRFAAANGMLECEMGVGRNYLAICDSATGPEALAIHDIGDGVRSVLEGREATFSVEYPCYSHQEKRWFLMTVTPLANDYTSGAVVMHLDITVRREAEQASERTLNRLTEAQRIGRIGDWDFDIESQTIEWSPEVFAIVGRDPLLGPPRDYEEHAALYDEASRDVLHAAVTRAIASGEPQEYELVIRRPDGQRAHVRAIAVPVRDLSGRITRIHGTIQDITAVKRLLTELQERQDELQETQRLAGLGSWFIDFDEKMVRRSDVTSRIFGLRPQPAPRPSRELTDDLERVLTPESFQAMEAALQRTRTHGEAYENELEVVRPDQTRGWVLSRGEALRDTHGRVYAVRGTALDITARKGAEVRLAELSRQTEQRERLLTTMLSSIHDFTVIFDREGRLLFVNQPLLDLWGIPLESAVGKTFRELGHPEELADRLQRQLDQVFATGNSVTDETPFVSAAGVPGSYEYIFSAVDAPDGCTEFVVGSTRDITERKRVEDELRASNENFQQLADNITDAFWIRSADMRELHYVSPAFERIWGRTVKSLHDDPRLWSDFIVPEDRQRALATFAGLTEDTPSIDVEYRIARPDGSLRWVRARGFQVRDDSGKLVRNIGIITDITERREGIEALQRSELEFRTLAEAMPQIVWITDAAGSNLYFNQRWMDYTGLTSEQSRGDGWSAPFHPKDQQAALEAWQRATSQAGTYSMESRLRRSDGTYRWWLVRGVPLRDAAGNIVKWFGTCTDIHDIKLAELEVMRSNHALKASATALQASEHEQRQLAGQLEVERTRLVAAQQVSGVGSWETDLATMSVLWSEETHRIFETDTRSAITHGSFLALVHPEDRDEVDRALVASLGHHSAKSIEHRLLLPDGRIKFVEERWQVVFDDRGTAVRAVGTCQDHTERKLAEIAVQQSQRRLRDIIDGLGPSMFVALLTPDGILVEINRPPLAAVGLKAEDVLGKPFAETHWWTSSPAVQRQLRHAIVRAANGEASRYDVRTRGLDGAFIDLDFSLQPLRDEAGNVVFLIPSASVITERKQAEGVLRQVQKMEAVGQLAAGVAHEFNNILQTLMSMAAITRVRGLSPEVIRIAGEMEVQIRRGASLTEQLLVSSRRQDVTKSTIDLRDEVGKARDLLRRLLPENIKMSVELPDERAVVEADSGQIQQVLLNLAINARDAMPDGGRMTLRVACTSAEASFEVEDNGSGFDEETREHLFEPFFTTKDVGKGSGLGLAVVYGIVEQHRGRIDVQSHRGHGSRFRITLPRSPGQPELGEGTDPGFQPASGRILLVEDEDGVREGIQMLLELIGYEVIAVNSAERALALPLTPVPDLLLSDVSLPGMGGPTLALLLRTRWRSLKITLMTGYVATGTRDVSREEGWAILQKPFDLRGLSRHLAAVVSGAAIAPPVNA